MRQLGAGPLSEPGGPGLGTYPLPMFPKWGPRVLPGSWAQVLATQRAAAVDTLHVLLPLNGAEQPLLGLTRPWQWPCAGGQVHRQAPGCPCSGVRAGARPPQGEDRPF